MTILEPLLSLLLSYWLPLFVWAMFRVALLNRSVAWLAGAPWGQSCSAYLWALDQTDTRPRWFDSLRMDKWPPASALALGWLGAVLVRAVRLFVDFWPWALFRQEAHCLTAWTREAKA